MLAAERYRMTVDETGRIRLKNGSSPRPPPNWKNPYGCVVEHARHYEKMSSIRIWVGYEDCLLLVDQMRNVLAYLELEEYASTSVRGSAETGVRQRPPM